MLTHLDRMRLHVDTLFTSDATGRLLRTREPGGVPAPRFYLGRSPHGNLWRFRDDLPSPLVRELARLAGKEPPLAPGSPPPERLAAFRQVLAGAAPDGIAACEYRGPAYCFPDGCAGLIAGDAAPSFGLPGAELMPISETGDCAHVLEAELAEWIPQLPDRQPCFAVVEGGRAVCLCCSARVLTSDAAGASPSLMAAEAGVETLPEHRGRGFAPRVVAAWARAVRERGGVPLYSAARDNKASQSVARKLGLAQFGEDLHWR